MHSCARKAKRYIDTCRDQLFDIATQYRASFPEVAYDGVLQGWMTQRITEFVAMLDRYAHTDHAPCTVTTPSSREPQTLAGGLIRGRTLPLLTDGTSLATLLSHSMYFGLSLGRVGADFRGAGLPRPIRPVQTALRFSRCLFLHVILGRAAGGAVRGGDLVHV